MPSPRNASAFSSFTTICSGVCFENFLMVIHSARPQAARTTQNNPLKTNGPKNPDPSSQAHGRRGISVTKFPLLAQKRGIRAVLPVQGEFCPGLRESAWSRESFVPVSVSLRKIGRVVSRRRPIGGRAVACEIGGEVSDRLWRGSWASSRRSWADLVPGINTHPDR